MRDEEQVMEKLGRHRTPAPEGFAEKVMDALPDWRRSAGRRWWPSRGRWIARALVGAAASLAVLVGVVHFRSPEALDQAIVKFHFELHAPGAERVELLGTFNNWQANDIVLVGPDASGHWTAEVSLPEGRHEYIFLVDGKRWLADPKAAIQKPDGFGRVNTVIKVYDSSNT